MEVTFNQINEVKEHRIKYFKYRWGYFKNVQMSSIVYTIYSSDLHRLKIM